MGDNKKSEHSGHRERMRRRFIENGLDGFEEHQALELYLFYAIPRKDTNPLAHRLLERYLNISGVCEAPIDELQRDFGLSESAATLIKLLPEMSRLYPYAVNCMRMATVYWKGESHLLYAVLKTGNHGKFVDNLENGGYACHMDLETGKVTGPGHTNKQELVEEHPMTGVRFEGFQVPYFAEACELAKRAAAVVPTVGYIGWDMAITENGPAIIEGNHFAAYDFPQLPDRSQNHRGLAAMLEDIGIRV